MAEFIARNGLIAQNNSTITGSLTVTAGIAGSLFGTASYALDMPKDTTIISGSTNAVQGGAVFDALALKEDSSIATTGAVISFDVNKIYNTATSPTALDITNDLTGAKIGVVQKIYSNKSVAPTVPAGWVKLGGDYTVSVLNIIYAEWSESSRVEYWIVKG